MDAELDATLELRDAGDDDNWAKLGCVVSMTPIGTIPVFLDIVVAA
jgi:hypothetical protein